MHLEHQIQSITWIPVVDTVEPVHDIDDDFFVESEEQSHELVDKIDDSKCEAGTLALDYLENAGTVDDVDMLEIFWSKLGGKAKEDKDLNIPETQKMESKANMDFAIGAIMT